MSYASSEYRIYEEGTVWILADKDGPLYRRKTVQELICMLPPSHQTQSGDTITRFVVTAKYPHSNREGIAANTAQAIESALKMRGWQQVIVTHADFEVER